MALPPAEIRYRKALLFPLMGFIVIMLAVFTGLTFFGMGVVNVWLVISWLLGVTILYHDQQSGACHYVSIDGDCPST
jgi:hypothetical protein